MLFSLLSFSLLILLLHVHVSLSADYYVSPIDGSLSTSCSKSCHHLGYYLKNSTSYFSNDTTFYFLTGTHNLNQSIKITNVHDLVLKGAKGGSNSKDDTVNGMAAAISCSSDKVGISIEQSYNVLLKDIQIDNCHLVISNVSNVTFEGVFAQVVRGINLLIDNCITCSILRSTFELHPDMTWCANSTCRNIYINYKSSILSQDDATIALIISHSVFIGGYYNFYIIMSDNLPHNYNILISNSSFYHSTKVNLFINISETFDGHYTIAVDNITSGNIEDVTMHQSTRESLGYAISLLDSAIHHSISQVSIKNSFFTNTSGPHFGGVFIQYHTSSSNSISIEINSCIIGDNKGDIGAGLYISFPDNYDDCITTQVHLTNVIIKDNSCRNNEQCKVHGALSLYNTYLRLKNVTIQHNSNLSGIFGLASDVVFVRENYIVNNTASKGGGIALFESSALVFDYGPLFIMNNTASDYGGGIYINTANTLSDPFGSHCFFQFLDEYTRNVMVVFQSNTASIAGDALYGPTDIDDQCKNSPKSFDEIFNYTNQMGQSIISSDPVSVQFCDDGLDMSAIPGQFAVVSIAALGYKEGYTPANVYVHHHNYSYLFVIRKAQCYNIQSRVFQMDKDSPMVVFNYYLQNTADSIIQRVVYTLPCPIWFELNYTTGVCGCVPPLAEMIPQVICDIESEMISRQGNLWVGYDESNNCTIINMECPFDYCNDANVTFNNNTVDEQCSPNRSGVLCGKCAKELSLILGSNKCSDCTNGYLALIVPFTLAGVVLIIFLLFSNLTVSVGTINGLIFYANVVKLYEVMFFPNDSQYTELNKVLMYYKLPIDWINLDLGIKVCFFTGMDAYLKTWLQFVFPFYLWCLILFIIYICQKSSYVSKRIGYNTVQVLATVVLLSYMKLFRTIVSVLHFSVLTYSNCNEEQIKHVWYSDSNIDYASFPKHLFLLIFALLILILLWIPFTVILLLSPVVEIYLSRFKLFKNWFKLKPIFDAYNGPYKDKYRFWSGILLISRLILLLTVSFSPGSTVELPVLMSLIGGLYVLSSGGIYRHHYLNTLEGWFHLNLLFISIMVTQQNAQVGTLISLSLVYITSLAILTYHIVDRIKNKFKKEARTDRRSMTDYMDDNTLTDSGDIPVTTSSMSEIEIKTIRKREPLIFDDNSEL
jgi:hypothetical protein